MKRLKLALLIVGIIALVLGTYVAWIQYRELTTTAPYIEKKELPGEGLVGNVATLTDRFDVTITYTDTGFSPADITVQKGQRVRFLNTSHLEVWPASGIHPTHTLYPEKESTDCLGSSFDACRGLQKGEFFDFTFNYVGTWRYHDHLHAEMTGSVKVTGTP